MLGMIESDRVILKFVEMSQDGIADSHLIEGKLGISARNRCIFLAARGDLSHSTHKGFPTYSITDKGELELLPWWRRYAIKFVKNHGWDLFKWVVSAASLGGAFAFAEQLLSKFF